MNAKTAQTLDVVGATDLLREDHRKIKELFREFESAGYERKKALAAAIMREIEVHTVIEEELFYPAARRALEDDELIVESEEAHHVAKVLLAELKVLPMGRRFVAKFQLMINNVRQHIREEESALFPKVERSDIDLMELGEEMGRLKMKTLQSGAVSRGMILVDEVSHKTGVGLGALLIVGVVAGVAAALLKSSSELR